MNAGFCDAGRSVEEYIGQMTLLASFGHHVVHYSFFLIYLFTDVYYFLYRFVLPCEHCILQGLEMHLRLKPLPYYFYYFSFI